MNEEQNTPEPDPIDEPGFDTDADQRIPTDRRPLGFWLRAVDALISREFDAAFAAEGLSRRDWMLLNALDGSVEAPWLADRLARKGGKHLRGFEKRGWADEAGDGTWTLTDEGRVVRERLAGAVDGIRTRIAGAVSPEDFATTMASLEAFARELGWDEDFRMPWLGRGRRGFGAGSRPAFGPAFGGFGPGFQTGHGPDSPAGFGPWSHHPHGHGYGNPEQWHREHHRHDGRGYGHHHEHGHGHHDEHGHGHGPSTESAYERGFDAGYTRGAAEREV